MSAVSPTYSNRPLVDGTAWKFYIPNFIHLGRKFRKTWQVCIHTCKLSAAFNEPIFHGTDN